MTAEIGCSELARPAGLYPSIKEVRVNGLAMVSPMDTLVILRSQPGVSDISSPPLTAVPLEDSSIYNALRCGSTHQKPEEAIDDKRWDVEKVALQQRWDGRE